MRRPFKERPWIAYFDVMVAIVIVLIFAFVAGGCAAKPKQSYANDPRFIPNGTPYAGWDPFSGGPRKMRSHYNEEGE